MLPRCSVGIIWLSQARTKTKQKQNRNREETKQTEKRTGTEPKTEEKQNRNRTETKVKLLFTHVQQNAFSRCFSFVSSCSQSSTSTPTSK
jgi:hypothetical protein